MSGDTAPEAIGLLMLREDLQFERIPVAQRGRLVIAALEDGRRVAETARARWGGAPEAMAHACRVPVIESDSDAGYATTLVFAEYSSRPPSITLYRPAIARLDRILPAADVAFRIGLRSARPLFLAHELYHHFDCTDPRGSIARRHPVTVLRLGRWRWTSGLRSLSEIAAGAFAQSLLDLSFHPRQLDLLLTTPALCPASRPRGCETVGGSMSYSNVRFEDKPSNCSGYAQQEKFHYSLSTLEERGLG